MYFVFDFVPSCPTSQLSAPPLSPTEVQSLEHLNGKDHYD